MNIEDIRIIEQKIYDGTPISPGDAMEMAAIVDRTTLDELYAAANRIRLKMSSKTVDLCTIMNAKSGKCSEDCKFCAQSAHYNTNAEEFGLVDSKQAMELAKENQECGANRFSLVTSGRGISESELDKVVQIYSDLNDSTNMDLCASLGILDLDSLKKLTASGITMYHHNLETSRDFYPTVCTTHTYDERIDTINAAKKAGMEICSGGIIGMGESWGDRISLAFELKELGVDSIPVNVLNPILGTPFESIAPLNQDEILKSIAIFRFVNPAAYIRLAGGRNMIEDFGKKCFTAGANASITGNYLTTSGNKIVEDIAMIESLGQEVRRND